MTQMTVRLIKKEFKDGKNVKLLCFNFLLFFYYWKQYIIIYTAIWENNKNSLFQLFSSSTFLQSLEPIIMPIQTVTLKPISWCCDFVNPSSKVIHISQSKQWLSTVANTIDCVCSIILNHGLNHGLWCFLGEKHSKLTWKFRIKI